MSNLKTMFAKMANKENGGGGGGGGGDGDGDSPNHETSSKSKSQSKKQTIEKTYQKKSQLEHILLRPDTYIGSVEKASELMWIYDTEKGAMVQKQIEYVPGLYKIFDEILVNAADNKQRDKRMDCIKIDINVETNTISVWNNGQGIPVVMHKDENMYVPTMIFGHLLTSSNYNDEEEKVTGGRNGYGAKLCNIFSTKFTVETASIEYKKQFKQTWANNMTKASEPKVKDFFGDDYTKITFSPDLAKFKMNKLDNDIVGLMSRRAYDVAASTRGIKVMLNGKRIPIKTFKDYVDLYVKGKEDESGNDVKIVYETPNDRWEVAVALSERGFQQMSFVNSIATTKGGRHVDYVVEMIVKQLIEILKKKNKGGINIKPFQVKNHMWIFINCLIVNPTFDSQTKENMTLQPKSFGSKCTLSEKFINQVTKSGIVEAVLQWAKFKAQNDLAKTSGKKHSKLKGIPKLEDANEAGTKNAIQCTLILTEGDSAKALAMSGLGVIGRDYYGVFPLRGKLLNVREATHKQILENAEINNLIKIIGLQYKMKYNNENAMKTLRYGKVMIMTDQDQDGSHIKGLLINFFHYNWPDLLQQNFLEEFITPIVKVFKRNEVFSFFSIPEFDEWKANTPNYKSYRVKYYKGLGSSDNKEAREYFSNITRHRIRFRYSGPQDDEHIVLAFSKKHIEHRKEWLTNFMVESKRRKEIGLPEKYLYGKDTKFVTYTDFINLELILFSNSDNIRSIPSICDGLKPGQRKVLYTCFKRNDKNEVKVVQLSGSVIEKAAYHHGDTSLHMTIVNLAQNFVGSNNINLLEPRGQFGTRLNGGKDSASPRYISTKLSPLTRLLFNPKDDPLLKSEYDDNKKVEPIWYIPIIPMVLVNGADGIGTGWSTKIPNYNPREIVNNIRLLLNNDEPNDIMCPWYKNFKGTILYCGDNRYVCSGEVSIISNNKIEITELPVGTWTQNYKENILEPLMHGTDKTKAIIADYKEYNTDTTVKFIITLLPGQMENIERDGIHKIFKLQTMITTSSMCVFDDLSCIKKYDTVGEILKDFYKIRLTFYQKRRDYFLGHLEAEAAKLSNQARFILEKCNGTLIVENKKRKIIIDELIKRGYAADPVVEWKNKCQDQDDENDDNNDDEQAENEDDANEPDSLTKKATDKEKQFLNSTDVKKFDYLLGMSMWMLTDEKKNELLRQKDEKLTELEILRNKTPGDLWREDLDEFLDKLNQVELKEKQEEENDYKKTSGKKGATKKKIALVAESLPSPMGRRIEPKIGEEIKKRIQMAVKLKENKGKRGLKKENTTETEEKDEFDMMIQNKKTIKDKMGTPEEVEKKVKNKSNLKQMKLNFKKMESPKKRGKKKGSDFESESDSNEEKSFDGPIVKERVLSKRKATKPVTYILSDDSTMGVSSDDEVLYDNDAIKEPSIQQEKMNCESDEEPLPPPPPQSSKPNESSEDMFDSLVGRKKIDDNLPITKKPSSKRKSKNDDDDEYSIDDSDDDLKKPKKKTKIIESDSDVVINNSDSDDNDDDDDEDIKKPSKKTKKKANNLDDNFDVKKPVAAKKGSKKKNDDGEVKKPAATKKKGGPKKKKDDSDDDFDIIAEKKKTTKQSKKKNFDSDEEDEFDKLLTNNKSPPPINSRGGGREKKQIKYVISDDEDDD